MQYVVEELVSVGVEDIVIVTGYGKRSIEDHFDKPNSDLIANIKAGGPSKEPLLKEVESIADMANFIYVRQKGPYGNGVPLLNAEHLIDSEPFIYTWSDDFIVANPTRFQQMIDVYKEFGYPVMSVIKAQSDEDYDRYGFAAGETIRKGLINVRSIVEKPGKSQAPSDMATVSGFVLTPEIFPFLHSTLSELPEDAELYCNDALKMMAAAGGKILACEIQNAKYYDAGNKLDYIKTVMDFALEREDMKEELKHYLKNKLGE